MTSIALTVAITWGQGQIILRVPQDFPTIEEAVAAAPPGATIQIAEGTYRAQLVIDKDLTLEGLSDTVIVRASSVTEPIVRVRGSANVTLRRVILDDGTRSLIVQDNAIVTLDNTQVRDATLGGVLVRDRGHLRCVQSKIMENHGRAGITAQDQAQLIFDACTIHGNDSEGVLVMGQARLEARQSLFERNRGAALVLSDDAQALIVSTRFTTNERLGIRLQGHAQLSIRQSEFFSNKNSIDVQDAAHLEAIQVRFRAEERGVEIRDQTTALIRECEFAEGQGVVIFSAGSAITLESNLFRKGREAVTIQSKSPDTRVLIANNTFEDRFFNAVEITSDAMITIERNRFERNLEAISGKFAQNLTVRNNEFFDNYRALGAAGLRIGIEDNVFEGNLIGIAAGVDDRREARLLVQRNRLKDTESIAIAIGGASQGMLTENSIHTVGEFGIVIFDEAAVTLNKNVLSEGKRHGVILSGAAQASLHENRFSGFEGCALYVGPKAKLIEETANSFEGSHVDRCGRIGDSWQGRLEKAPAGSVLEIPPGVYYESLWINKPIEVRSSGAVFRGNGVDPVVVVTGNAHVHLEGITLQDGIAGIVATDEPPYGGWFPGLIAEPGQQQLELRAVKILANGRAGIWADSQVTKLIIEGSELRDNGQYGVRFHGILLNLAESTITSHETGVFADLSSRERASVVISQTNFSSNQLGVDVQGVGELTLESSQITGGALGVWVEGTERGTPSGQALHVHIARSLIRDHRQERVTSLALALLAIFSGEFVGSGLALEGQADVTLIENEISENEFHGIAVGQKSSVLLERNKITNNKRYGIALGIAACMQGLAVPPRFEGRIEGKQNTVPSPGEPHANLKGAFCPKELEFLKTEQGGSYP